MVDHAPPAAVPEGSLSPAEAQAVLRYWLQAVRHAEALAIRPKARRPAAVAPPVDLRDPQEGAAYARLDAAGCTDFLCRVTHDADVPVEPGVQAFFERWLKLEYRSEIAALQGWAEAARPAWIVGWPVLHFAQRDELGTLLRFETQVRWRDGEGAHWKAPDFKARRRNELPAPPVAMHLHAPKPPEDEAPFSIDPVILGRTLGLTEEEITGLFNLLRGPPAPRPLVVVRALCLALEQAERGLGLVAPPDPDALPAGAPLTAPEAEGDAAWWFERLHRAVSARLPEGVRAWPYGLVFDGSPLFATYHLQRELADLLRKPLGQAPWGPGSGLWAYLSGRPTGLGTPSGAPVSTVGGAEAPDGTGGPTGLAPGTAGWRPLLAVRTPRGVTEDQRAVAERFLGSALTAAQGPPGTGKTELILNLAAHAVAERALALALNPDAEVGAGILMVTSTNNRAVDNVIDPLGIELPADRLPLALRTGSQPVVAGPTADMLGRVLAWLDTQDATDAEQQLKAALARLRVAADASEARLRPVQQHQYDRALLAQLEARLAAAPSPTESAAAHLPPATRTAATRAAKQLVRRLEAARACLTAEHASQEPLAAVSRARAHLARLRAEELPTLEAALADTGLAIDDEVLRLGAEAGALRPAGPEAATLLDEQIEDAQDAAEALLDVLLAEKAAERESRRRAELATEVADLRARVAVAPPAPTPGEVNALGAAVYERALLVRERWAVARQFHLRQAVSRALAFALEERSLRKLFARAPEVETWLRRLFPVWGCTLLSLGNVFDPEADAIDRLVIDEAGQCHPAYAVSGLMRARQTLCIGDVFQLEPVIDLTASDEQRLRWRHAAEVPDGRLAPYRLGDPTGFGGAPIGAVSSGVRIGGGAGAGFGLSASEGGASAQSLADRAVRERLALHDHFRCQPEIIGLSDRLCNYRLRVHTPPRSLVDRVDLLRAPHLFGLVLGEQIRARGSWLNEAELEAVMGLLRRFDRGGIDLADVAVITPYTGQLERLHERLRAVGRGPDQGGPALGTVHRFQGGERRVVIFSTVVTRAPSLPFIDRRVNLLNVAISRAMDHFIVLGDAETLRQGRHTRLLVEGAVAL